MLSSFAILPVNVRVSKIDKAGGLKMREKEYFSAWRQVIFKVFAKQPV